MKTYGAHLKASAATVRLRLYDVLALLPPETYEGILAVLGLTLLSYLLIFLVVFGECCAHPRFLCLGIFLTLFFVAELLQRNQQQASVYSETVSISVC